MSIIKSVIEGYRRHNLSNLSASIAFFGALSIAPFFVIITYIFAMLFGESAIKGELFLNLKFYVGSPSASIIEKAVSFAKTHSGKYSLIVSSVVLLCASSILFQKIWHSLHIIWEIKDKGGFIGFIGKKGYALTGVFLYGMIGALCFGLYAFLSSFSLIFGKLLALFEVLISFIVLTISFSLAYKLFSGAKVKFLAAIKGAIFASILFIIGRILFSFYIKWALSSSLYAVMGSLMTILLWLYFSSLFFLIGAEIAKNI